MTERQSSMGSTLAGMALFLATAAMSQWIRIHHQSRIDREYPQNERDLSNDRQRWRRSRRDGSQKSDEEYSSGLDNDTSAEEEDEGTFGRRRLKEAFRQRRLKRRMSFHQQMNDSPQQQQQVTEPQQLRGSPDNSSPSFGGERDKSPPSRRGLYKQTEWDMHCSMEDLTSPQPRYPHPPQSSQPLTIDVSGKQTKSLAKPSPAVDNDRYHDFHPKYQNWSHFEHCNEHDRARQRRKAQIQRLQQEQEQIEQEKERLLQQDRHQKQLDSHPQQQQQQQQRSSQTQDAGQGASQNEGEEIKQRSVPRQIVDSTPMIPHRQISQHDNPSRIENVSEEESQSSSVLSFGSGNQYVWTTGHASKHHRDESSKSSCSVQSNHNRDTSAATDDVDNEALQRNLNRIAIRSGTDGIFDAVEGEGARFISNNINGNNSNNTKIDNRMGKFERFYRMLTSSIMDDDTNSDYVHGMSISSSNNNPTNCSSRSNSHSSIEYDGDIEDRHRAIRTEYNAQIMPEKLVLIRHGQSMGNVDEAYYATTPDNAMPLTDLGWEQARKAGTILKDKIITPGESVHFIVSPYVRTVETFHGILSAWCDPDSEEFASIKDHNRKVNAWYEKLTELGLTWNEDSRIREQDFGNYQNPEQIWRAKQERWRFGAFYYRFQNGESGSDVFDRVSTFLDSLWRSFETNKSQNYVLVTHGIVLRVLMARYFRYTISQLNMLANPRNCEMVVLGHEGNGRLDLEGRCALELEDDPDTGTKRVKGYRFHKRLRILSKSDIRTVKYRISPRDQIKARTQGEGARWA